jgi:hypothetical protein
MPDNQGNRAAILSEIDHLEETLRDIQKQIPTKRQQLATDVELGVSVVLCIAGIIFTPPSGYWSLLATLIGIGLVIRSAVSMVDQQSKIYLLENRAKETRILIEKLYAKVSFEVGRR